MKARQELDMDDDLVCLWEALFRLRKKLDDYTISEWRRINPFVENLFDWKEKGALFGNDITIFDSTSIIGNVTIGDHTWVGPFCSIDGTGGLTIGSHVTISAGCRIMTHDTVKWTLTGGRAPYEYSPVKIGDCTFLGVETVVLRGVTIGECVLIGANSLVNKDVPSFSFAVGQPARVIGRINVDDDEVTIERYE